MSKLSPARRKQVITASVLATTPYQPTNSTNSIEDEQALKVVFGERSGKEEPGFESRS